MKAVFFQLPGTRRFWILLALAFALGFGFFEIVEEVFDQEEGLDTEVRAFDTSVLKAFANIRSPLLTQSMIDLTALGSISVITVLAILMLSWMFLLRDWFGSLHLTLALLGAVIWPWLLKNSYGRVRPDISEHLVRVSDLSFPSGHSFGSAVAYSTFALLCARHFRKLSHELFFFVLASLIVMVIGMSRIYLGVHFPTDVMAGICAGGVWSCILAACFSGVHHRRKTHKQ